MADWNEAEAKLQYMEAQVEEAVCGGAYNPSRYGGARLRARITAGSTRRTWCCSHQHRTLVETHSAAQ